jgi:hypothetical protein
MTPRRLFRNVLLATLALDLVLLALLRVRPFVGPALVGRFVICLAAGCAAARHPRFGRAAAAAAGAVLLATVLSLLVYVSTGAAVADLESPARVYAMLIGAVPLAAAGTLIRGATASLADAAHGA